MINLHIIGVQKAGTTALASFLHQHPDIYVVDGKEAHIFDHPTFSERTNKPRIARLNFKNRLSNYKNESIRCDATPITLFREEFLTRCIAYNPDAKFIVILRDPVDRAVSHYKMSRSRGFEKRCMLFAFLLEHFRLRKHLSRGAWPFQSPMRRQSYLSRGLYRKQISYLKQLVPESQVHVIHQEDLLRDHQKTLDSVFEFLCLEKCQIPQEIVFNSDPISSHWTDSIARLYARCYFKIRN